MQRQGFAEAGGSKGGGGRSSLTPLRRGLSREIIDSLPLKRCKAPSHGVMGGGGDVVDDASSLGGGGVDNRCGGIAAPPLRLENNKEDECCPICLKDFADRSEVRTLPCGHDFDRECIDSWVLDHTTSPTCRENIDNVLPPLREGRAGGGADDCHGGRRLPRATPLLPSLACGEGVPMMKGRGGAAAGAGSRQRIPQILAVGLTTMTKHRRVTVPKQR
jgi:hypothetical protein